jgi:hypothetical protein
MLHAIRDPNWDLVGGYTAVYERLTFPADQSRRIIDCSFTIVPTEDPNLYEAFKFEPLVGAVFLPASPAEGYRSRYLESGHLSEYVGSITLCFKQWSLPHSLYVQYEVEGSYRDMASFWSGKSRRGEENKNWFEEGF